MQRAMAATTITSRTLVTFSLFKPTHKTSFLGKPSRLLPKFNFKPLCTTTPTTTTQAPITTTQTETSIGPEQQRHSMLLERLRHRNLKETSKKEVVVGEEREKGKKKAGSFWELGLNEEVMGAVSEMGIQVPTEIQCIGVPAVLEGKSAVLGSHTGSGKTLAYLLPLVQLLRQDEASLGRLMKPRRPRAVVLCPTRELSEQVFRVAKAISHHARFRSIMVSGGGRLRPQEDSLSNPVDMVVGTPGRVLQHIEDGNMVYGDIKYLVLDEADTMFDRGFGPDIRKFLGPLKNRALRPGGQGFQTVLVTATMTKAVQKLVDEEFQGILHLRTSTLHKKIASARHDFIKLSGSENKLEALMQVLEPSLAKGNRVMVFCNTLNSSRAVDHFLSENQISTVNYHGEVPAEQRVENLEKFKSDDGDCPTLVCTDLAARGLDLDVDHVIMFDFPMNSIDYLHRTGRTARMGAKGKVTSLVAKKDAALATRIEEAIRKNESLESLTTDNVRRDIARARITEQKGNSAKLIQASKQKNKVNTTTSATTATKKASGARKSAKTVKGAKTVKSANPAKSKTVKSANPAKLKKTVTLVKSRIVGRRSQPVKSNGSKLNVVGFRGRSSSSNQKEAVGAR